MSVSMLLSECEEDDPFATFTMPTDSQWYKYNMAPRGLRLQWSQENELEGIVFLQGPPGPK